MSKRILVYSWGALGEKTLITNLMKTGAECITFCKKLKDYHSDGAFSEEMLSLLHTKHMDAVFSYDYFPLISMLCEMNHIPYISWIYDCPMTTLMSKTLQNECNHIFCFDALYTQKLVTLGAKHAYHCPLATDEDTLERIENNEKKDSNLKQKYTNEIAFVGNLYNGEKNRLRKTELSEYTNGYLKGLIGAQMLVYGYNFLSDSLTTPTIEEIAKKCHLVLSEKYILDVKQMVADAIGMEVTAREREQIVKKLSDLFQFSLYSTNPVDETIRGSLLTEKGYADYDKEMPYILHNSKINLNITSRTIQSGIPQRVLDILSCGGFCITNYQPEIAEFFEDGVDLVMYSSLQDLITKVDYYLKHNEERIEITRNGNEKVKTCFSLDKVLQDIFEVVFKEN